MQGARDEKEFLYPDVGNALHASVFEVYRTLGHGFLEKVYERALACELSARGVRVRRQAPIKVRYKGHDVGTYLADLVLADAVIVEIKAQATVSLANCAQLLNYLAASGTHVGYLVNFHYPRATVQRFVL